MAEYFLQDTLHNDELFELLNSLQSTLAPFFTPTENASTPQDFSNSAVVPDLSEALQYQDELDDIENVIMKLDQQHLNNEQIMSPQPGSIVPNHLDTPEEFPLLREYY